MTKDHTIVMFQFTQDINTRTYLDYESTQFALDGICQTYERALKLKHPKSSTANYTAKDLFDYLDALFSVCALVRKSDEAAYVPRDKQWLKLKLVNHLKSQSKQ